jgi:hypothetical protein
MKALAWGCCLALAVLGPGCATLPSDPCCPQEPGPKTLLPWGGGPKYEPNADGTTEPDRGPAEAEPDQDEIVTDRPDFTESSATVGKGRMQLEVGYTYGMNKEAGVRAAHSYPEGLLRVGMFADWFELRLGQNFANTRTADAGGGVSSFGGAEDLYLGTKFALTEQKKYLPESALVVQMTVPTGHRNLTARKTLPGLNYLYGWEVNDFLSCGGSTQGNLAVDDDDHTYLELAQSFTMGYKLTEKLGAYTEWFAFFPSGANSPGITAKHYFNGGFTYKLTPLFQLDLRAGKGLSRSADDYFVGAGFAVKK